MSHIKIPERFERTFFEFVLMLSEICQYLSSVFSYGNYISVNEYVT